MHILDIFYGVLAFLWDLDLFWGKILLLFGVTILFVWLYIKVKLYQLSRRRKACDVKECSQSEAGHIAPAEESIQEDQTSPNYSPQRLDDLAYGSFGIFRPQEDQQNSDCPPYIDPCESLALLAKSPDCDIDVTDDHVAILQAFDDRKNLYVTGKAGTGKSTLLKYIERQSEKLIMVLAPTGVAAVNIGGETIHSFFGLPYKYTEPKMMKIPWRSDLIEVLDAIIIDEVSMVSAHTLACIDEILKRTLKNNQPFGGVQIVLFGDLSTSACC